MCLRVLVIPLKGGSVFPSQKIWLGFYDLWIKWGRNDSVWKMSLSYKRQHSFCQALSLSIRLLASEALNHHIKVQLLQSCCPERNMWKEHLSGRMFLKGPSFSSLTSWLSSQPKCQKHVWGSLQMSPCDSLSKLSYNLKFPDYCLTILCLYLPKMAMCYFLVHTHFQSIDYLPKGE